MKLLNDGIHDCKKCEIYKEYGIPCSSQPELSIPSCQYCDTRMCCRSPAVVLMKCEQNTILDKIDEGEYIESEENIPFNIKTRYCKHMDMKTMNCKVYKQRPITCRIAGNDCLGDFWVKAMKEQHERNKEQHERNKEQHERNKEQHERNKEQHERNKEQYEINKKELLNRRI